MKRALLIVDIQKDYFKGGKNELFQADEAAKQAEKLICYFHEKNEPVIYIRHISQENGAAFFAPGTEGTEIYPALQPAETDSVFVKHVPDSFMADGLADYLRKHEIDTLAVCGMMSHMCIDTTVRSARTKGYDVTVLEDACTTMNLTWNKVQYPAETIHNIYMASLNGTFAAVMKTDEYIKA